MADLDALVASPWWRWMPRMRGIDRSRRGFTVLGVHASGDILATLGEPGFSSLAMRAEAMRLCVPDVADPATLGCLLAIMYAAEAQHITPNTVSVGLSQYGLTDSRTVDAIISAILAAPPPGVSRG